MKINCRGTHVCPPVVLLLDAAPPPQGERSKAAVALFVCVAIVQRNTDEQRNLSVHFQWQALLHLRSGQYLYF